MRCWNPWDVTYAVALLQQFEVLLLVGAGIGVTPFASVLADLVNRMEAERAYAAASVQVSPMSET